jgi:hypothetical protein
LGVDAGVEGAAGVVDEAAGLPLDLDASFDVGASLDSAGFDSPGDSDEESELLGA